MEPYSPEAVEFAIIFKTLGDERMRKEKVKKLRDLCDTMGDIGIMADYIIYNELILNDANLALRIAAMQKYFALPWWKRIFTRPSL